MLQEVHFTITGMFSRRGPGDYAEIRALGIDGFGRFDMRPGADY